jgi:hypothetical protein
MNDAGREVHVLTVQPLPWHPVYQLAEADLGLVSGGVHVHRVPMGPLNRLLARLMKAPAATAADSQSAFRRYLSRCTKRAYLARPWWQAVAIPDASADWLPHAVYAARRLLGRAEFHLVVSLGNPHTCHLAAFLATRGYRCEWVPFYGDAWGLDPGLSTRPAWTAAINRRLERRVLKAAARIMVCTDAMRTGLVQAYGIAPAKIASTPLALPDLDCYEAVAPRPVPGFHLAYTGSIYEALQDPLPFLRAASRISSARMTISFLGAIPERYARAAAEFGLNAQFVGWRPLREVIAQQKSASALVVFGHRGGHVMPSKVFEYFAARRPILCIRGDREDLAAPLVQAHRRGLVVNNCAEEIGAALNQLLELHANSQLDSCFDLRLLRQYDSRATATRLMNGIIGATIAQSPAAPVGEQAAQEAAQKAVGQEAVAQ